jgi:hypothetical protein
MHTCNCNFSCADYTIIDLQGNIMNHDVNDLIAQLEHARERLNAALEKVAPQVEIYSAWKLKQVMDHIAGWDELMVSVYRAHTNGEPPVIIKQGIDQYNAVSVGNRKELSLEQSRQEYAVARENVILAIREMSVDKLTQQFQAPWGGMCTVAKVVKIFVSHELEHAKQIEGSLNRSTELA